MSGCETNQDQHAQILCSQRLQDLRSAGIRVCDACQVSFACLNITTFQSLQYCDCADLESGERRTTQHG